MAIEPKPWDEDRRARVKAKIDKESARAAARLGAEGVVIVAFFAEGEYLHMQDGGKSPMPFKELYQKLLAARQLLEESGGEDVKIQ